LLFVHIFEVTLGKIHFGFFTSETIVQCSHHRPNTFCPNFGSYIWQNPIQLFDDTFHPFLKVGGGVKANPSTAAAVKNYYGKNKTKCLNGKLNDYLLHITLMVFYSFAT